MRHRPAPPPSPPAGRCRAATTPRSRALTGRGPLRWLPFLVLAALMSSALVAPVLGGVASPLLDGIGQGGAAEARDRSGEQPDASGGPGVGGDPVVPPAGVPAPASTAPTAAPTSDVVPSPAVPSTGAPSPAGTASTGTSAAAPAPDRATTQQPGPAPAPAPTSAAPPAAAAAAPPPAPAAVASAGDEAGRVLALVNEARAGAGCGAVTADTALSGVARAHSAAMRDQDFFGHTDPDGRSPFVRAEGAGVTNARAENIARGQRDADAVMRAWLESPGHRRNILDCDHRTMGLGVATGSGGPWWTQMFGA